jgi:hypothetical protein
MKKTDQQKGFDPRQSVLLNGLLNVTSIAQESFRHVSSSSYDTQQQRGARVT